MKRWIAYFIVIFLIFPCIGITLAMPTDKELILVDQSIASDDMEAIKKTLGAENFDGLTLTVDLKKILGINTDMRAAVYYVPGDEELVIEKTTPEKLIDLDVRLISEEMKGLGFQTGIIRLASLDTIEISSLKMSSENIGKTILKSIDTNALSKQIKHQLSKQASSYFEQFWNYIRDEWFIITNGTEDGQWLDTARKAFQSIGLADETEEMDKTKSKIAIEEDDPDRSIENFQQGSSEKKSTDSNQHEDTSSAADRLNSFLKRVKMAFMDALDKIWGLFS